MKVIFAGTPEFAAVALQALHEAGFEIPLVLTQPDRPAGRGMQLQPSAVKQYAVKHGIEVLQPLSLRMDAKDPQRAAEAKAAHERLLATDYDVMVVAAYGLILPRATLDIKPCLNIHGSLLPRWRGAAPIHRAIESGDAETGVTIMEMEEGLDTGPMLLIERMPITPQDTTATLHDKLAAMGAEMMVKVLHKMEKGVVEAVPQPEHGVTYANKITPAEARIDWSAPARQVDGKVRGLSPHPGAWFELNGARVKALDSRLVPGAGAPGVALDDQFTIACGEGAVRLIKLQREGRAPLPAAEFLRGNPVTAGAHLT